MKALFWPALVIFAFSTFAHAEEPKISGPWTQLRKTPLFESDILPLAKTWGPNLPIGNSFQVEKVYGRWIFGRPSPIAKMKEKDYAPAGWIYSRMLLLPGDLNTENAEILKRRTALFYHSKELWKKLGADSSSYDSLNFLEGLSLSEGTIKAFSSQDDAKISFHLFPQQLAWADDAPSMGLTGVDLTFLEQEFKIVQQQKQNAQAKKIAKVLMAPKVPALTDEIKRAITARQLLPHYLDLPKLSHEEVDGYIYMRATTLRALRGCAKPVQDFWKNRPWNIFRFYRLKSQSEIKNPWLQVSLPSGYFAVSARAIDVAANEAELAFLLIRPLVRELRLKRKAMSVKNWPNSMQEQAEEQWQDVMKLASTRDSENLDIADEIAVDMGAVECLSRAGYKSEAGLNYLQRLVMQKDESWAKWYFDNSIGIDYRMERVATLLDQYLAKAKFPRGSASNRKRFSTAEKFWNILP